MAKPDHQPQKTLRQLRQERGWSQVTLGVQVGVTGRTISNWERGLTRPTRGHQQVLAQLLGVRVEAITFEPATPP